MRLAILFLILVFLIDLLGFYIGSYRIPAYDTILHFSGGLFVAMLFYHYLKEYFKKNNLIKNVLIIVGATMFIGAVWEFAEYTATLLWSDYFFERYEVICCIGNLDDTINDLLVDLLGALVFSIPAIKYRNKS